MLKILAALAVSTRVDAADPALKIIGLDHVNVRASNPTASAHFYQSLFGGELLWAESIPINPYSPQRGESWFLALGATVLAISPTFPTLASGLDHICPRLQEYESGRTAAILEGAGLTVRRALTEVWLRDPDENMLQLHEYSTVRRPSFAAPKPGDTPATEHAAFVPVSIAEVTWRAGDPERTSRFYANVFGGLVDPGPASSRTIRFGRSTFEIEPATSNDRVFFGFGVAIKNFSPDAARRALRERGITPDDNGRRSEVRFTDPDGIRIRLLAPTQT